MTSRQYPPHILERLQEDITALCRPPGFKDQDLKQILYVASENMQHGMGHLLAH